MKRKPSKPSKSGKVTKRGSACGADPAESLFPEQAPKGCVLVRAHYRRVKGRKGKR